MGEIRNLTRNGETFYPLTHIDGIIDRDNKGLVINDIFDVSEYNASGDPLVPKEYGSLSSALSDIPLAKQKPGMTIRFIESVNHTYLQYRLISSTWSTNTDDWDNMDVDIDDTLSPLSNNPVTGGGIVKDMFLMEFVGKGTVFVENTDTCINWIKGHTYRVYPRVTEWYWGISTSTAKVFQLGYVKTDDTRVLVADVPRGTTTPTIKPYYDITLPDDGSVKSLFIGGRATEGYVVKCVVEDITYINTYINDTENLLNNKIDNLQEEITDISAFRNYIPKKGVGSTGSIGDSSDKFISTQIPVQAGDTISWRYSDVSERCYLTIRDAEDTKLSTYTSNNVTNNGLRNFTVGDENAAYLIATFFDHDGYEPSITKNGEKVWVKTDDGRVTVLENNVQKLQQKEDLRLTWKNGYIRSSENGRVVNLENLGTSSSFGWLCSEVYIPVKEGDSITWEYGKTSSSGTGPSLSRYDENKQYVGYFLPTNGTNGVRVVTMPSGTYFIRISWYKENTFTNTVITTPLKVNDKEYYIDLVSDNKHRLDLEAPVDETHGQIGKWYAKEIKDLESLLEARLPNRFHFIHLSDNHNTSFVYAQEIVDLCPAKFLVNTGDMVNDKFTDGFNTTLEQAQQPTKPVYLIPGNHDYYKAPSQQAVFDAFVAPMNSHNGTTFDKTYFSVDYSTEKVKCIYLDMNEGYTDEELATTTIQNLISGKMSGTQINWLVSELQAAATGGLHVCIFIHAIPVVYEEGSLIDGFRDKSNVTSASTCSNLKFLCDIVDAFIKGTTVAFTYLNVDYEFTFTGTGSFVAWFAGHTHIDMIGRLKGYTRQWGINVCRPNSSDTGNNAETYQENIYASYNFVTIDTASNRLGIYRIGGQDTVYATKRKSVRIFYKENFILDTDSVPTRGSINIVKSGEIWNLFDDAQETIAVATKNKYIDAEGSVITANGYIITEPIELLNNQTIKFSARANGVTVLARVSVSDETYTPIIFQKTSSLVFREYEYTSDSDCYVVVCSAPETDEGITIFVKDLSIATKRELRPLYDLDSLPQKYSNKIVESGGIYKSLYEEQHPFEITSMESPLIYSRKGYINYSGVFVSNGSYFCTLPLFVRKGEEVVWNYNATTMGYLLEAVDENDMPEDDTPYNVILKGTTSGEKTYTAPRDMWLVFSGAIANLSYIRCNQEEFEGIVPFVNNRFKQLSEEKEGEKTDIMTFNPPCIYDSLVANAHSRKGNGTSESIIPPVTLGWFSDLHGNRSNLVRLLKFVNNYSEYVDDIISTGDTLLQMWEDDYSFWDSSNAGKVLQTIGNHDVWTHQNDPNLVDGLYSGSWYLVKQKNTYDRFIAPYVSEWGVTQPQDASSGGKCYYYKDYTYTNGSTTTTVLRLIVLDCMHIQRYADLDGETSKQITWFESVLDDARQNSIPVVAAYHWLVGSVTRISECTFNSYDTAPEGSNPKLVEKVEGFIANGGEFVCWLTGHQHFDITGLVGNTNQIQLSVDTAASSGRYSDSNRVVGNKTQDSFNIITFDTREKLIKVVRVGNTSNRYMQSKLVFVYRYANISEDKPAGLVLCR